MGFVYFLFLTILGEISHAHTVELETIKIHETTDQVSEFDRDERYLEESEILSTNTTQWIEQQWNLSRSSNFGLGAKQQIRSFGGTAEDTLVTLMGVSLNLPQGGGYDFNSFPGFLWSELSFGHSSGSGVLSVQGGGDAIALTPWTLSALSWDIPSARFGTIFHSLGEGTLFAGYSSGKTSVMVGTDQGREQNWSGSVGQKLLWGKNQFLFHFIGSRRKTPSPGTRSFPSPDAKQFALRGIGHFQWDLFSSRDLHVSTTLYGDWNRLERNDTQFFESKYQSSQWGWIHQQKRGTWTFGIDGKKIGFFQEGETSYSEWNVSGRIQKNILNGNFKYMPYVRMNWIESFSPHLVGGLLFENDLNSNLKLSAQGDFSRRYASLSDRYFKNSFFIPHPKLAPEKNYFVKGLIKWTPSWGALALGVRGKWRSDLHTLVLRNDGRYEVLNKNSGWISELFSRFEYQKKIFDSEIQWGWSNSKMIEENVPIPLTPQWKVTFLERWKPQKKINLYLRWQGQSAMSAGLGMEKLSSYGRFDMGGQWSFNSVFPFQLNMQVRNIFDREIVTSPDGFPERRVFTIALEGRY